jgi:hypothetical protein
VDILSIGGIDDTVSSLANDRAVIGQAEGNALVSILFGGSPLGQAPADAAGKFTYTLTDNNLSLIGQGTSKSLTASQTILGLTGTSPARLFAVDTTAPTITITSSAPSSPPLAAGATASLTFELSEPSNTFTRDKLVVANGLVTDFIGSGTTFSAKFTPTADFKGLAIVSVAASAFTDLAGNPNGAGDDVTLQVNTKLPAAPTPAPLLLDADDSGTKGDLVTNVSQPRLVGMAAAGLEVTLVATDPNGTTSEKGKTTADADGRWTIKSDFLSDGLWTIQARAADLAGNRSVLSPETKLTIDTAVPDLPTVALATTSDSGVSNSDGYTKVTTPTFLGTAKNGVAAAGLTVTVYRKNLTTAGPTEAIGSVVTDAAGQWILPFDKTTVPFTDAVYNITAKAMDTAGNVSLEGTLATGLVIDTTAPTVDALVKALAAQNQAVPSVSAKFNENILGLQANDFTLKLTAGGVVRTITLAGRATVTTASPGASYDDTWTIGSVAAITGATGEYTFALNQARIQGGKTTAVDLAGNALAYSNTSATWITDTTAPTVTSMIATPSPTPATASSPWNTGVTWVDVAFSENVTGVDKADFVLLRDGAPVSLATANLTGSDRKWRLGNLAGLTAANGVYTLTLKAAGSGITDKAGTGNPLSADFSTSWRVDTVAPTAVFTAVDTPRATPVSSITLTFPETVTGVEKGDFSLTRNGLPVSLTSVTLSPAAGPASSYAIAGLLASTNLDGTYVLSFNKDAGTKVTDAAGNAMLVNPVALTWTVDTTKPTATITQPTPALRNTPVTTVGITFSSPVAGVDANDFQLVRNGVSVPLTGASVTPNSATSYTLTIPQALTTPDGVYGLRLAAVGANISATALPNNPLVADADTTWTMDATRPGVILSVIQRTGTTATVRALFSENVTGFVATAPGDVTVTGGTIGNARNGTLVGREYLFDVTPTPANPILPATVTVNAGAASDGAGNTSVASDPLRIISDTTPPTVVLIAPAITNQSPFTVNATFSEPVTGLTAGGVAVTNGVVSGVTGGGTNWTIQVTPTASGSVTTVALVPGAAKDGSDNPSSASNTVQVAYDNVSPSVTLASQSGSPTRANTILISATFSEPVTGVTAGDLVVTSGGGTVVGVTGSGSNYTFQVQPSSNGAIGLEMPANAASDAAGNGNTVSNTLTVVSDRSPPKVVSMTGPVAGVVTITFTEQVRGFDIGDLLLSRNGQSLPLSGATLSGPTVPNNTTWTLSLGSLASVGGSYRLQIAASAAGISDLAGNPLADDRASPTTALIYNFVVDTTPPVATFAAVRTVTNSAIDAIGLSFSKPVNGVDLADLVLSRDRIIVGRLNTLPGVSLDPASGPSATYAITGLAPFTGIAGRYALQLVATESGIADASGNPLVLSASTTWTLDLSPPTATFGPVAAIVAGSIPTASVSFSEQVRGVDVTDFTLTRNDAIVPLAGVTLVTSNSAAPTLQLTNLASVTNVPGVYRLTLRAAGTGIADAAGNLLAADVAVTWRNSGTTAPGSLTGAFGVVTPNPRAIPVATLPLSFSTGVTGFGPEDVRLTRTTAGVTTNVPTTGLTVTGAGASWIVGGLSALTRNPGDYVLRVIATGSGIRTSSGIALASDVVATWRTVATPAAPTATIALKPPASIGAAYDSATITFSKQVTGVTLSAFVLLRGTVPVSLTGTSLVAISPTTYRISGLAPLTAATVPYELRLVAAGSGITGTDGSTLQTDASVTWTQTVASLRAAFLGIDRVTTAPVAAAKLRFSESVRGVDVTDFVLTVDRNDGRGPQVVELRGVTISGSGSSWTVTNLAALQAGPGKYVLRLTKANGDIRTSAGNTLAEDAVVKWTLT